MWTYFRENNVEFGVPQGNSDAPLRPHLHDVVQVMLVTDGSRQVTLGAKTVKVETSCALIIPAGVIHVASQNSWAGFNAYLKPSLFSKQTARLLYFENLPQWTLETDKNSLQRKCDALLDLISNAISIWEDPSIVPFSPSSSDQTGWPTSREARIRRYQREAGISPYAHEKAKQLDQARRRIAQGESIASVTAHLGFTDQAHLGRQFKASFGTSPGRYSGR